MDKKHKEDPMVTAFENATVSHCEREYNIYLYDHHIEMTVLMTKDSKELDVKHLAYSIHGAILLSDLKFTSDYKLLN